MNINKIRIVPSAEWIGKEIRDFAPEGATVYSLTIKAIRVPENLVGSYDQEFEINTFKGAVEALGLTVLETKFVCGWNLKINNYGGAGIYLLQYA